MVWGDENLVNLLKDNGVIVMPTDTLYGIVGRAQDVGAVNRIYSIRKRNPKKPCIILIANITQLKKFSIFLSLEQKKVVKKYWPGPVSIILDCPGEAFSYLHRGTETLAFRIPAHIGIKNLLKKVGPLIAPSANPEGLSPAQNIMEAKNYFGNLVDMYVDVGNVTGKASKVIKLHKDGAINILRA